MLHNSEDHTNILPDVCALFDGGHEGISATLSDQLTQARQLDAAAIAAAKSSREAADGLFEEIVRLHAGTGDTFAAIMAAKEISDPTSLVVALVHIGAHTQQSGCPTALAFLRESSHEHIPVDDLATDLQAATALLSPRERATALRNIIIRHLDRNNLSAAYEAVQGLRSPRDLAKVLMPIAAKLGTRDYAAAFAVVHAEKDTDEQDYLYSLIAVTQAEVGDFSAAFATLAKISESDSLSEPLERIAYTQISVDIASAMRTANRIPDPARKKRVLTNIKAKTGALSWDEVAKIPDSQERCVALMDVVQSKPCSVSDLFTVVAAVDSSELRLNKFERDGVFGHISRRLADIGAFSQAIEMADRITSPSKSSVLTYINVCKGDFDTALATAVMDSDYAMLAMAYARAGDIPTARTIGKQIKTSSPKAKFLVDLSVLMKRDVSILLTAAQKAEIADLATSLRDGLKTQHNRS